MQDSADYKSNRRPPSAAMGPNERLLQEGQKRNVLERTENQVTGEHVIKLRARLSKKKQQQRVRKRRGTLEKPGILITCGIMGDQGRRSEKNWVLAHLGGLM